MTISILRLPDVKSRTGLSRSTIYLRISQNNFPAPISLGGRAVGWIAGLVNALPTESIRLFELARDGKHDQARELYEWFLPLLRLDTGKTFVQKIKLAQERFGIGNARVRGPRLDTGEHRRTAACRDRVS